MAVSASAFCHRACVSHSPRRSFFEWAGPKLKQLWLDMEHKCWETSGNPALTSSISLHVSVLFCVCVCVSLFFAASLLFDLFKGKPKEHIHF